MEGHLNLRIQPWIRRLITRLLAIIPAFFTILYFGDDALSGLLILSQVVLSLQLGFAVIPLIHFTSDKKEMKSFAIKPWVKILAWLSATVIVMLNIKLVVEEIGSWTRASDGWYINFLIIPVAILIGLLLIYIFVYPIFAGSRDKSNVPHGNAINIDTIDQIKYDHIGITVDFSKNDRTTIEHAMIQGGKKAIYHLIHVVETAAARYHGTAAMDHETQRDAENLEKYADNLRQLGYQAVPHIGFGRAATAIAAITIENKLDLLVMGAHGHKGLKDLIFGTTVESVRHKVTIPVLVVR